MADLSLNRGEYRAGTVNVNTGAENTDRWISAGAAGVLTVGTSAPTATSGNLIWSDRVGARSTILLVRTVKTVHAAGISWTVRRAHGWSGLGDWVVPSLQIGLSATLPAADSGPCFMEAGGTGARNLLTLPATAVFLDASGSGSVGTTEIVFSTSGSGLPVGHVACVLEFHTAATAIVTTNTFTIETQWIYVD